MLKLSCETKLTIGGAITMDYTQDTTKHKKGKHFSYGDRRELQGILSNKSVRYLPPVG